MLGVVAVVLVLRCDLASERTERHVSNGITALAAALAGDDAAFARSERAFSSGATLTDPYPLFALEIARRLRDRRFDDVDPGVRVVLEHLRARRYPDATRAAAALPPELAGRAELARLVAELHAAHLAAEPTSGR